MDYINKNAVYKELIRRHGKGYTYIKVCAVIEGKKHLCTEKEQRQILALIREIFKEVEENISKS